MTVKSVLAASALLLGVLSACGARTDLPGDRKEDADTASTACRDFCDGYTEWCGYTGSCVDDCLAQSAHLAPCEAELEILLQCMQARVYTDRPDCIQYEPLNGCKEEINALDLCVHAGACVSNGCSATISPRESADLDCDHVCGDVTFISRCDPNGSTVYPMSCVCQLGDETLGTCRNVTNDLGFGFSCCAGFFAEHL